MNYFSIEFVVLLCVALILNYVLSKKTRMVGLLLCSLILYGIFDLRFIPLIIIISAIVYLGGLAIQKRKSKYIYIFFFLITLMPLLFYKYMDFTIDIFNKLVNLSNNEFQIENWDLIVPLGISFLTFQSITYLGDVYHARIRAERNIVCVFLFVTFFPSITSGPIQKARDLIPQFYERAVFNYDQVKHGFYLIAFGCLQKYLISDKLSVIINPMIENIEQYSGFHIMFFSFAYAIYIYSNFNSYSDIAIGISEILGIKFQINFKRPYLATSIKEFWQRWHISLNQWFTEYVYIPLGGSKKGNLRKYINITTVFLVSGLWHGASFHFIAWGGINAIYQIVGSITKKYRDRLYEVMKIDRNSFGSLFIQRSTVFILISISWIFFSVPSTMLSLKLIKSMLIPNISTLFDNVVINLLGDTTNAIILLVSIFMFFSIQTLRENNNMMKLLEKENKIFKYTIYTIMIIVIIIAYFSSIQGTGNGGFIYVNF